MIESYRRWFTYERHAHALVLDSFRQLNTPQQATPSFQKAVDLFAHIVAARRMWLFRFGFAVDNAELLAVIRQTLGGPSELEKPAYVSKPVRKILL